VTAASSQSAGGFHESGRVAAALRRSRARNRCCRYPSAAAWRRRQRHHLSMLATDRHEAVSPDAATGHHDIGIAIAVGARSFG
jgi:hypothetical protein